MSIKNRNTLKNAGKQKTCTRGSDLIINSFPLTEKSWLGKKYKELFGDLLFDKFKNS